MDDNLACRYGQTVISANEATTDTEDNIRVLQKVLHGFGHGAVAGAQGQGVIFREGTLTRQTRHYRCFQKLLPVAATPPTPEHSGYPAQRI